MKPTDYDMVKLALSSVDLVILRALVQQAMKRRTDDECQRLDLLTRARDLLAEFYLIQGNENGRELGKSRTGTGVNPYAKPLLAYGTCAAHLSRITPRRRSLSGRTK
jgi:hypothetical protein